MYGKTSLKGAWLSHVNHLNFGGHNHIPGTADHLRRCQLSSPVSVINFWRSVAMLITSTVEICIQQLGRVEEMVFTAQRSYASAVLGAVILSICPSVRLSICHTVVGLQAWIGLSVGLSYSCDILTIKRIIYGPNASGDWKSISPIKNVVPRH